MQNEPTRANQWSILQESEIENDISLFASNEDMPIIEQSGRRIKKSIFQKFVFALLGKNNLTETEEGFLLDARQGTALKQKADALKVDVNQNKPNLIPNSGFFDTRNSQPTVGINWACDFITSFRVGNTPYFTNILKTNNVSTLRIGVPDADVGQEVFGANIYYIPHEVMKALKGKTVTLSFKVYFGRNYTLTAGGAGLRIRLGGTNTENLVGLPNGDLQAKKDLGTTLFVLDRILNNQTREQDIEYTTTFTVPELTNAGLPYFDGVITAETAASGGGVPVVNKKSLDPLVDNQFFFQIKELQLTVSETQQPYKQTGYIESYGTSDKNGLPYVYGLATFGTTNSTGYYYLNNNILVQYGKTNFGDPAPDALINIPLPITYTGGIFNIQATVVGNVGSPMNPSTVVVACTIFNNSSITLNCRDVIAVVQNVSVFWMVIGKMAD